MPAGVGLTSGGAEAWASDLARSIAASVPDLVGADPSTRARGAKIRLVDRRRRPPVVPYGVVARRGAPVAVPLRWEELDDPDAGIPAWSLRDVAARIAEVGDPWADLVGVEQELPAL